VLERDTLRIREAKLFQAVVRYDWDKLKSNKLQTVSLLGGLVKFMAM
jgi:hypothetical protein